MGYHFDGRTNQGNCLAVLAFQRMTVSQQCDWALTKANLAEVIARKLFPGLAKVLMH